MRSLRLLAWVFAVAAFAAWHPYADAQDRSAVVAQKLRLLEALLRSPRATEIQASGDAGARALYDQARRIFEDANAIQAAQPEQAEPLLDSALRLISQASKASGAGAPAASQLRQQHADLTEQVRLYRQALDEAVQRRPDADLRATLATLDQLSSQATAHANAGRIGDANKALAQAYQTAIAAVSRVRAGETVVIDLKFATPADEYEYEQRRFRSTLILVDVMGVDERPAAVRRALEGYAQQGRDAAAQAEAQAASGDHAGAIRRMEEATRHLTRALQMLGVQAF